MTTLHADDLVAALTARGARAVVDADAVFVHLRGAQVASVMDDEPRFDGGALVFDLAHTDAAVFAPTEGLDDVVFPLTDAVHGEGTPAEEVAEAILATLEEFHEAEGETTTRSVAVDARRIAEEGTAYTDTLVGLTVVHTTADGLPLIGRVESFVNPADGATGYPIIRFGDGRWTRADLDLVVVDDAPREA